jgi:hypothetical protein
MAESTMKNQLDLKAQQEQPKIKGIIHVLVMDNDDIAVQLDKERPLSKFEVVGVILQLAKQMKA